MTALDETLASLLKRADSSLAAQFAFVLKASRPGFWSTSVWFYLLTVAQQPVLTSWTFWTFWLGVVYFSFHFGLLLYGWNDFGDRTTDRINPRKGNYRILLTLVSRHFTLRLNGTSFWSELDEARAAGTSGRHRSGRWRRAVYV